MVTKRLRIRREGDYVVVVVVIFMVVKVEGLKERYIMKEWWWKDSIMLLRDGVIRISGVSGDGVVVVVLW